MTAPQHDPIVFHLQSLKSVDPRGRAQAKHRIIEEIVALRGNEVKRDALADRVMSVDPQAADANSDYMSLLGALARDLPNHRERIIRKFETGGPELPVVELVGAAFEVSPLSKGFLIAAWQQILRRPDQLAKLQEDLERAVYLIPRNEGAAIADTVIEASRDTKDRAIVSAVSAIAKAVRGPVNSSFLRELEAQLNAMPARMKSELAELQLRLLAAFGRGVDSLGLGQRRAVSWGCSPVIVYRLNSCFEKATNPFERIFHVVDILKPTHVLLVDLNIDMKASSASELDETYLSKTAGMFTRLNDVRQLVGELIKEFKVIGVGSNSQHDDFLAVRQRVLLSQLLADPDSRVLVLENEHSANDIENIRAVAPDALYVCEIVLLSQHSSHPVVRVAAGVYRDLDVGIDENDLDLIIDIPVDRNLDLESLSANFYPVDGFDIVALRVPYRILKRQR